MTHQLTVFYDGGCPLCRREIGFYMRQTGASRIAWLDISRSGETDLPSGLSRCNALKRFHVQDENGKVVSGARAFAKLWITLDSFRWVGRLAGSAPVVWAMEGVYRLFLISRPVLQYMAKLPVMK